MKLSEPQLVEVGDRAWFQPTERHIQNSISPFVDSIPEAIKFTRFRSPIIPTLIGMQLWSIDQLTRTDFFAVSEDECLSMVGREHVPDYTVVRFVNSQIDIERLEGLMNSIADRYFLIFSLPTKSIETLTTQKLAMLQMQVTRCRMATQLQEYLVSLCEATRQHESVVLGVSPRGMLIWQQVAKAWAVLHGRDFVIPDDIQAVARPVLRVRLVTRGVSQELAIDSILDQTEVPTYR